MKLTNLYRWGSKYIMRWLKPNLRSSIYGLLGNPVAPSESMLETGTEDVREAMLAVLGDAGPKHFPQITRRIRYANDSGADVRGSLRTNDGEGEIVLYPPTVAVAPFATHATHVVLRKGWNTLRLEAIDSSGRNDREKANRLKDAV